MNKFAKILAAITIVAFFATILWLNTCFRICSDDCFYGSLTGPYWIEPFHRLDTLTNAFLVTCTDLHRPLVHFVVRVFTGCWPKWVFNIANTVMMGFLILLISRMARRRWLPSLGELLLTITLVFLILCKGESFTWIAGSVNYLWAGAAALVFCLIRRDIEENDAGWGKIAFMAVPVFLLGWSMEAFVLPILFGLGLTTLIRRFHINKAEWTLYIAYFLGSCLLIMVELSRVESSAPTGAIGFVMNLIKIAVTIKAVWLLVLTFIFVREKKVWLKDNRFELSVILGSILMIVAVGFNGERSLWAANLFAIILLLKSWRLNNVSMIVISLVLMPLFGGLAVMGLDIRNNMDEFLRVYTNSSDGVAGHCRVNTGILSRFFYQAIYTWQADNHERWLSNYYGCPHTVVALPGDLYDTLYLKDCFCTIDHRIPIDGEFYTSPDITTIVHPLKSDEIVDRWRVNVDYRYPDGVITKVKRDLAKSSYPAPIEPDKGYVLKTAHGRYLLISKEYKSDSYIKAIRLTPIAQ